MSASSINRLLGLLLILLIVLFAGRQRGWWTVDLSVGNIIFGAAGAVAGVLLGELMKALGIGDGK